MSKFKISRSLLIIQVRSQILYSGHDCYIEISLLNSRANSIVIKWIVYDTTFVCFPPLCCPNPKWIFYVIKTDKYRFLCVSSLRFHICTFLPLLKFQRKHTCLWANLIRHKFRALFNFQNFIIAKIWKRSNHYHILISISYSQKWNSKSENLISNFCATNNRNTRN